MRGFNYIICADKAIELLAIVRYSRLAYILPRCLAIHLSIEWNTCDHWEIQYVSIFRRPWTRQFTIGRWEQKMKRMIFPLVYALIGYVLFGSVVGSTAGINFSYLRLILKIESYTSFSFYSAKECLDQPKLNRNVLCYTEGHQTLNLCYCSHMVVSSNVTLHNGSVALNQGIVPNSNHFHSVPFSWRLLGFWVRCKLHHRTVGVFLWREEWRTRKSRVVVTESV